MRKHIYDVAIVGCGSIGALKDDKFDTPGGERVLTHAHAFHSNKRTRLKTLVDSDDQKLELAAEKWGPVFITDSINRLRDNHNNFGDHDIIVVASPTETHFEVLTKILQLPSPPKLVVAEKPFCIDSKEARAILTDYKVAGIPMLVNYTRRFALGYMSLVNMVKELEVYHASFYYGRGLWRDGCHAVDILHQMFGRLEGVITMPQTKIVDSPDDDDITISAHLAFEKCHNVSLVGVDSRKFSVFELRLMTEEGQIFTSAHGQGLHFQEIATEQIYGSYPTLGIKVQSSSSDLHDALPMLARNCVEFLDTDVPHSTLLCNAEDALRTHETLECIYDRRPNDR
jgi:predicted dehydrogenase